MNTPTLDQILNIQSMLDRILVQAAALESLAITNNPQSLYANFGPMACARRLLALAERVESGDRDAYFDAVRFGYGN